jgi:thioesterase domain-containing protein
VSRATLNENERELKKIWQHLLNVKSIALDDDFYQLGGDALLVKALAVSVLKHFKLNWLEELNAIPSIFCEQLSLVSKNSSESIVSTLVPQSKKGSQPLVFIHPIGGTLFSFTPLLKHLSYPGKILGIYDPLMKGDYRKFDSLERQAEYYVEQLLPFLSQSCFLAGYSSGGTLACEMSRLLNAAGVSVSHLFLFDSWACMPFGVGFRDNFKSIIERQIDTLRPYEFIEEDKVPHWYKVLWNRMRLVMRYKPSVMKEISASVYIPEEPVPEYTVPEQAYSNWKKSFKLCEFISVKGCHENMLDGVDIQPIAESMKKIFSNVDCNDCI